MPQDRPQPHEDRPDPEHDQNIDRLAQMRSKIKLARADYRVAPTMAKETALRALVKEEEDLSFKVGFGAGARVEFGR